MLLPLDSSLLMAVAGSFMVGLLGYIVARLWITPIVGYNLTKRKLDRELTRFLQQVAPGDRSGRSGSDPKAQRLLKQARRHAVNLETRYHNDLPAWYRLYVASRNQSPEQVLALLAPLSKWKDGQQVAARVNQVRNSLGFF